MSIDELGGRCFRPDLGAGGKMPKLSNRIAFQSYVSNLAVKYFLEKIVCKRNF